MSGEISNEKMPPHTGARYVLRLQMRDASHAIYAAELALPAFSTHGTVSVQLQGGDVRIELERDVPEWLSQHLQHTLRGVWRTHAHSPWPRRIARWRAGPGKRV